MITNTGKNILAKYLVGQTPAYASYIAVGCGPKPMSKLEFDVVGRGISPQGFATITVEDSEFEVGMAIDVVGVNDKMDGTHKVTDVITKPNSTKTYVRYVIPGYSLGEVTFLEQSTPFGVVRPNFKSKTKLDFEMFRVPIISRGYVTEEAGTTDEFGNPEKISKVVLTAELPSTDRYEISEIGVFSAKSNPLAANIDSRILYSFASNEGWQYHNAETGNVSAITTINGRLDGVAKDNRIKAETVGSNQVFQSTGSNDIFLDTLRIKRFEQPRFLDNTIFISGIDSNISVTPTTGKLGVLSEWQASSPISISSVALASGVATITTASAHNRAAGDLIKVTGVDVQGETFDGTFIVKSVTSTTISYDRTGIPNVSSTPTLAGSVILARRSSHIHLTNTKTPFEKNSPVDELQFAFSVVNADGVPISEETVDTPDKVRVMVEFTSNDAYGEGQYARLETDIYHVPNVKPEGYEDRTDIPANKSNVIQTDLTKNRYFVVSKQLQELTKSPGFTWDSVKNVKVYASVMVDDLPVQDFYVCLDGLRFENVSTQNPVYGLTGYSLVTNNIDGYPSTIIKSPNTSNYIEFRFAVDI
jgi:hypothetical protein